MKNHTKKIIFTVFLLLAVFGLADSIYLTAAYYSNTALSCDIFDGCNIVAQSEYGSLFGVRLSVWGILFYVLAILLSVLDMRTRNTSVLKYLTYATGAGFLSSLYFVYLQLFVINAICIYCMWSALSATILFILSLLLQKKQRAPLIMESEQNDTQRLV